MRITIVGCGNIGTQFAVHCAEKGHQVIMFGSKPDRIQKELTIVDENDCIIHKAAITIATSDARTAFEKAEIIFVTMPAFCMDAVADQIYPYVAVGMKIGLIPGTGGGECAFRKCLERGAVVFGLQRVPSVARLTEYGRCVRATGYRSILHVAALPTEKAEECAKLVGGLFDLECIPLPNYLNLTLTPSNPILHTTRLRTLFRDYQEGTVYSWVPMFYEDWTDESSELLLACDEEVQRLCEALPQFDLSSVRSLRLHYESDSVEEMTRKISGIKGFQGLASPALPVEGGYIPDFSSRYFMADYPYGLALLVQIAELVGVDVPNMRQTLDWFYQTRGKVKSFAFSDYGIDSRESLIAFYSM